MKSSIFLITSLTAGTFARPKPQLLDLNVGANLPPLLDLNLGAKVTVFSTVTVAQPASTCLPASITGAPTGQSSPTPSLSRSTPLPPLTPWPPLTPKPTSTSPTSWSLQPQPTSKPPVASVSTPQSSTSTTLPPKPSLLPPPNGIRLTGAVQAYLSVGTSYQASILFHHNAARANHGAAPLTWDTSCEANARRAAETCNYTPYLPVGVFQGQNLYLTAGDAFNVTAAITETWYKKEFPAALPLFGGSNVIPSLLPGISSLTQVLWKSNTKVGCASVDCSGRMKVGGAPSSSNRYTVCNYGTSSNIASLFTLNVGRPLSTTNLGKWTD